MRFYSIVTLILAIVAVVGVMLFTMDLLSTDPTRAAYLSTTTSVASFALAFVAVLAAIWTIDQQALESRRQRQMETLHLLTAQYEGIFDEIHSLRGKPELRDQYTIDRLHNRYFTNLMKGFRCYQLGLVSGDDYEDWTATAIGRFRAGGNLLDLDGDGGDSLGGQWRRFDGLGVGPRGDFRAYMKAVIEAAARTESAAVGDDIRRDARKVLKPFWWARVWRRTRV